MSAPVQGFENTSSAHGAELGAIPFNKIIGGPLTAVIHAQVQSAMATVDFVKKIGFKPPEKSQEEKYSKKQKDSEQANFIGNPVIITFEYEKTAATGMPMPVRLKIPFLTMLPIPTLRVDEVYIDFLAKINSVSSVQLVDDLTVNATTTQIKAGNHEAAQQGDDPYTWTAAMTGTLQQQRQSKTGASITRDYSLGVKVKCVQDELPAGLGKLLDILESAIQEQNKQAAQHNSLLLKPQSVGGKAA